MKAILRVTAVLFLLICLFALTASHAEPYVVTVRCGENSESLRAAACSWHRKFPVRSSMLSDTDHPLRLQDRLPVVAAADGAVTLSMQKSPSSLRVECWEFGEELGMDNAEGTRVSVSDLSFTVPEGKYVLQITVSWDGRLAAGSGTYFVVVDHSG